MKKDDRSSISGGSAGFVEIVTVPALISQNRKIRYFFLSKKERLIMFP